MNELLQQIELAINTVLCVFGTALAVSVFLLIFIVLSIKDTEEDGNGKDQEL